MLLIYRTSPLETFGEHNPHRFRPHWFSKEKSLKNAFAHFGQNTDFRFVYDGDSDHPWLKHLESYGRPIHLMNFKQNQASLIGLYEYVREEIESHDSIYLLEDDFVHKEGSQSILQEALSFTGMATLYHHPDRFTRGDDITDGRERIWCGRTYYRTMESTTGTFALTKEKFLELYPLLLEHNINDRDFFRAAYHQGTRLVCPIESYSTHVHTWFFSRFVDWEKEL